MRSWKTPALLAVLGLCGLGSLSAQNPLLPMAPAPTPIDSTLPLPTLSAPQLESFAPSSEFPAAPTPSPIHEVMEQPLPSPVYSHSPMMWSAPSMGCSSCAAAPAASCNTCAAPALVSTCDSCAAPQQVMTIAPACGCQGGSVGSSYSQSGYGPMGSGSGVDSGLLSPNANSGGLHTRYPYYNYRHPWYYQGPPSQNVTIVW